jgi:putative membrane protein
VAFPLVLATFALGLKSSFARHRQIAKWTFPLWLYVSVTGVLVFAMLKIWNP